jgi:TP901-1 family phage major tail protein
MINLQMFAEAVHGKKLCYLFRILKNASAKDGATLMFTTENERTKSKDSDSTATKDGSIQTPGAVEQEITATAYLAKGDELVDELEDALDNDEIIEVWEANLDEPAEGGANKFKGRYFQGYLTECGYTSSAEEFVEVSLTFAINGSGVKGDVTVTTEQQEMAAYAFADTAKKA